MTGTAIVLSKAEMDDLANLGNALRDSGYFNDAGTVAQAAVKVLAGRELGLGPVASMRSLHIVEGKIELSADLLAQRVKQHPRYDYRVEHLTAEECRLVFYEDGSPTGVSDFSIGDAAQAGLLGRKSQTWERYPRNMLFNRALTNGVAWFCPDVAGGGSYIVEGGVTVDAATGEIIEASDELEPAARLVSGSSEGDGMGESDGSPALAENTGAAAGDPTSEESVAYGEGAAGSSLTSGAGSGDAPVDAGEERTLAEPSADDVEPPSPAPRALSSQTQQLLRHAAALRWTDPDIRAALEEAYPGVGWIRELDQEQARELIREWAKLVKATRVTQEQKERLKALATNADVVTAAQIRHGADHIKNVSDMTVSEADVVIHDLEAVRANQAGAV